MDGDGGLWPMDGRDWLAERFEEHRPRLRAVAYRALGSASEADDAVQETWLRLSRSSVDEVENLGGWLTTIVARVALNMLRSRTLRREEPMDWPVIDQAVGIAHEGGTDPEHEAVLGPRLTASDSFRRLSWRAAA
jgi:DNA-directed RNA polymerase specialized sigma24 family protein